MYLVIFDKLLIMRLNFLLTTICIVLLLNTTDAFHSKMIKYKNKLVDNFNKTEIENKIKNSGFNPLNIKGELTSKLTDYNEKQRERTEIEKTIRIATNIHSISSDINLYSELGEAGFHFVKENIKELEINVTLV